MSKKQIDPRRTCVECGGQRMTTSMAASDKLCSGCRARAALKASRKKQGVEVNELAAQELVELQQEATEEVFQQASDQITKTDNAARIKD